MLSESACAYPLLGNFHKPIVCQWCKHLLLNVWRGGIPLLGKGTKGWYLYSYQKCLWEQRVSVLPEMQHSPCPEVRRVFLVGVSVTLAVSVFSYNFSGMFLAELTVNVGKFTKPENVVVVNVRQVLSVTVARTIIQRFLYNLLTLL